MFSERTVKMCQYKGVKRRPNKLSETWSYDGFDR